MIIWRLRMRNKITGLLIILVLFTMSFSLFADSETNKSAKELFTYDQWKKMLGGKLDIEKVRDRDYPFMARAAGFSFPQVFDWRDYLVVTPVTNQGACGSCWAFAAVAQVEAEIKDADNVTIDLSEQQLVDCVEDCGCDGGWTDLALKYIRDNGIVLEEEREYKGLDGM
jgi:C1A family cysteine protease